jgi:hypothetical protein
MTKYISSEGTDHFIRRGGNALGKRYQFGNRLEKAA